MVDEDEPRTQRAVALQHDFPLGDQPYRIIPVNGLLTSLVQAPAMRRQLASVYLIL